VLASTDSRVEWFRAGNYGWVGGSRVEMEAVESVELGTLLPVNKIPFWE